MKTITLFKKKTLIKDWIKKHIKAIAVTSVVGITFLAVLFNSLAIANKEESPKLLYGTISAQDISINSKIPGRIAKLYVTEGQSVKSGDPLVEITSDELEAKKAQLLAQINQAEAGVEASKASVEMANANYELAKDRVAQAQAGVKASTSQKDMASATNDKATNGARTQEVAQAESAFLLMDTTYQRALILFDGGAISQQKLDEIKTQRDIYEQTLLMAQEGARSEDKMAVAAQLSMAQAGIAASNAVLSQASEAVNIAMAQVNQANAGLIASEGKLEQAKAGLAEIEVYLSESIIKAPIDGTVTTLNSDVGELVSTGTSIGTVSNLETCWVSVDLDESKLNGLSEGQTVSVNLPAYPDQLLQGTVVTINKQPDFAVKKATNENGNLDLVSYAVKIELDNNDALLRPGMTATVDFETPVITEVTTDSEAPASSETSVDSEAPANSETSVDSVTPANSEATADSETLDVE
ncbi:HlyD family secretion protein [Fusibacter ferrireducens]|uniref:HlyD family secretion protein n=1 Tax=Fusibacter ferrireducens TaxID=2785058 RepID=A0ABR9ZXC2_9FIRM|nr:efflux RND transporter periplasmic adaptor subunit [Fusibacter ferrireducens]MBF4695113.1 HlyD family secretion protein [Fusibacter ferrireducens]